MVRNKLSCLMLTAALVSGADSPGWVSKSDQNAQTLLEIAARYYPESAGQYGMSGLDDRIIDLQPKSGERRTQEVRLNEKYHIPYRDVIQTIFSGIQALLDDQVASARRPAALTRLRRYTGLEAGYTPLTVLAERRTREKLNEPGLRGPATVRVNKDLANTKFFVDGIGELLEVQDRGISGRLRQVEGAGGRLRQFRAQGSVTQEHGRFPPAAGGLRFLARGIWRGHPRN